MMMFFFLPFLFLIPFALFWMMRSDGGMGCGMTHASDAYTSNPSGPSPIDIARQRLARGEITTAEYEEIRRVLG